MTERERRAGGMVGLESGLDTAENYRRFAQLAAAGRSPRYEELALAVARDRLILSFLERLPPAKRQPNLLFAAARQLLGLPPDHRRLRSLVSCRGAELAGVMLARRTQTNEPARCAVLLPALASLPEPLALIEVGAAAGLTLLPDLYSYDYGGRRLAGLDPQAPTLTCRPLGPVPLPDRVPRVIWRAGIDLNPLDVRDPADVEWLSCLIWPDEEDRAERLRAAVAVARRLPPFLHRGDLLDDLPRIAAAAPADATLVVYHTAVLAYVEPARRAAFAAAVGELGAVWLSNEGHGVLPDLPGEQPQIGGGEPQIGGGEPQIGPDEPQIGGGEFLLVRDGAELLARSDSHGRWLSWAQAPAG